METDRYPKKIVARHLSCSEIKKYPLVKEKEWNPSYLDVAGKQAYKVNLIGVIIKKEEYENYTSFMIEDFSGKVEGRRFGEKEENIEVGDVVLVLGKPREWNSLRYVAIDLIKKTDSRWLMHRKAEKETRKEEVREKKEEGKVEEEKESAENLYEKIIEFVNKNDGGEGCEIDKIIKEYGAECESIVQELINHGELFEIKPGKLKVL